MSNLILPRTELTIETVPYEQMRRLAAASDVLEELGLQLVCQTCTSLFGHGKDGVMGNNDPQAKVWEVRCGCTVRRCEVRRS